MKNRRVKKELNKNKKQFNKILNKESVKYAKQINHDPEGTIKYLKAYNEFVKDQYTKNSSKLNLYLDRYYFLEYKKGYMKSISVGVLSSLVLTFYLFYQEGVGIFLDTIWNGNLEMGTGVVAAISEFLIRITVVGILILILLAILILILKFIDNQIYTLFNKEINTLLIQIERNHAKELLNKEFNLKI